MGVYGYALLLLINCDGNRYNCDSKPVDNQIYSSLSECEWERQRNAAYYDKENLVCAKVQKRSEWDRW